MLVAQAALKQKVVLIAALSHNPKILIMDEPFVGLDPKALFTLKEVLKEKAKEGKIIFSGWMFSSNPSLSAMEHPNYDIWLLECKNDPNLPEITLPKEQDTNISKEENAF